MQELLNKSNINNSIELFFIVLTSIIPQIPIKCRYNFRNVVHGKGARGSIVVEAVCCKPEGRGIATR
jgi:hypothetical protein